MKVSQRRAEQFDELILRVKTLEEILGFRVLYHSPTGFNKKTVEKWLRRDSYPRRSSLQEFCSCAGLTVAEFEGPIGEFARIVVEVSRRLHRQGDVAHAFDEEQVWGVIENHQKGGGLMAVLSETIHAIGKKTLEKYYREFRGYYVGYLNWTRWDRDQEDRSKLSGGIFRCLIKVDALDQEHHVITAKLTTRHHLESMQADDTDQWACHGVMVPVPGKLIFLFEVPNPSFEEMDFVFIMTQNAPKDHLLGIIASDSSVPDAAAFMQVQPVPAASRILLEKAKDDQDEASLFDLLDYRHEIPQRILEAIKNEVHPDTGILMTHFLSPRI